ncbi:MAG: RND family transporter [Candidatus Omnitrophica bacterium]|nr:RND family transporter [Candidatus Omnitrophota bacterium]
MFKKLAEIVLVLKWPLVLSMMLVSLLTGYAVFKLRIDPSVETLFDKRSPEYQYYRTFTEQFGSDQLIAVAMRTHDLFEIQNLRKLKYLTGEISKFKNVERVLSLANVKDIQHKFLGVKVIPLLKDVFQGEKNPAEVRGDILRDEFYVHNLVSPDGKVATILIYLKPSTGEKQRGSSKGLVIEKLKNLLDAHEDFGVKFYMAGAPVEHYEFVRLIRRDQFVFVPLIVILLIVTTMVIYRSFSCMVLSMTIVSVSLIWTMGTISLVGQEMNLVTSLLAPVVMIVAIANTIHIMNLFLELRPHHPSLRKSVVMTMEHLGIPNFLTNITTVLGFVSLAFNPIPAIQSFGIFAALGTFYSYVAQMLLTPILLPILPYRRPVDAFDEKNFFNRVLVGFIEKFEFRWKWLILLATIVITVFSIQGISKLRIDTSLIKQLKPDSELAISTRFIDENLTGIYSLGFVIKRKDNKSLVDYETLKQIDQVKEFLESKPEISNVNSVTTLIKKINKAREGEDKDYVIPDDQDQLGRYFKGMAKSNDPQLWAMITKDFKEARLDARMHAVGTQAGALLEKEAREYLDKTLGRDFNYQLTGNVVLLGKMAENLVHNQMVGFIFSFLSILSVIVIFFRSFTMGLLAAIPNMLPILAIYGLMGMFSIELSTPTAMISSIVLGMVVDASIHFLHRFRYEFSQRHNYLQSLHHTYRNVGQALFVSTMILAVGFASSVFASFRPTVHFGVLTSCTIVFALICTLLLLPVFIIIFKPFGRQRLFKLR